MWTTPDLSVITTLLTGLLTEAVATSPLNAVPGNLINKIKVSPASPESVRPTDDCQLTLYLLQISRDPAWRNTPLLGQRPQRNSAQPLSLTLCYLLTAFHGQDALLEQQAMSIALAAIQANPIISSATTQGPDWSLLPDAEFVLALDTETLATLSQLWQAFATPLRLCSLVRASVIFLQAPSPPPPVSLPPSTVNLSTLPVSAATAPLLGDGAAQSTPPLPPGTLPAQLTPGFGPLVAVGAAPVAGPGTTTPTYPALLTIAGSGLDLAEAANVYLRPPGSAAWWDITAWRQGAAAGTLVLALPATYATPAGSPLTATPPPGLYSLAVGSLGVARSNEVPLAIAPRLDVAANPPLLSPDATGLYTLSGAGFLPAAAITLAVGATPVSGFTVNAAGTQIIFHAPGLAPGAQALLLAVNGIPAPLGWLVEP